MTPSRIRAGLFAAAAVALTGQSSLDLEGPPGSGKPSLTSTATGGLLATWFEPRAGSRFALRIAAREGGRWTEPRTVAEREDFFVNWADFPSAVETGNGAWAVHWLQKTAAKPYAYHVMVAISRDQGATWSPPVAAHDDTSATEHGFVAMVPRPGGGADLAWLDGRAMTSPGGPMGLRVGTLGADGRMAGETLLDGRTCECCQVAMARTSDGLVAAYRDRTDGEIRDIAVVRQVGGRWTDPKSAAADGWEHRACPVNGPSLTANGRTVALGWYTAAGGTPRVKLAFSRDGGGAFGPPVQVDDGSPMGRVETELLPDGAALVVWLETVGEEAEWRVRRIAPGGRRGPAVTIARTIRYRDGGFARAALAEGALFVAWTAPPDGATPGRVRVRRLAIPRG